jgi:predicted DNA-binding protein (MmcQ/YjbR family)
MAKKKTKAAIKRRTPNASAEAALAKAAKAYPNVTLDHPWDPSHNAFKIKGKIFVVTSNHDGLFNVTVKLPITGKIALMLPFAEPTGYGMGKHGWVTARFKKGEEVPIEMVVGWIDESFRAVAPKRVIAALDE